MYVSILFIYNSFIKLVKGGSNIYHLVFAFHKENFSSWRKNNSRNTACIYVNLFVNYLQFLFLVYRCKVYPILYVSFSAILFNNIMMEVSDIYVRITGYLFQDINMHWWKEHIQHSMLAITVLDHIPIYTYQWERSLTCILSDGVYMTHPLNWLKVEVTVNI